MDKYTSREISYRLSIMYDQRTYLSDERNFKPWLHMALSKYLKDLRSSLNLTQCEMAHKLHVDPSRISRWENGEQPTLDNLQRIGKVFKVDTLKWLEVEEREALDHAEPTTGPRVIHMKDAPQHSSEPDWRMKAVDLMSHMTVLLESMLRSPRGGGALSDCASATWAN